MSAQMQINGNKIVVSDNGDIFKNGHKMVDESYLKKGSNTSTNFEKGSVANSSSVLKGINVALKNKKLDDTTQKLEDFGITFSLDSLGRLKSINLNEEDRNVTVEGDVYSILHNGAGNISVSGDTVTITHKGAGNISIKGDAVNVSHHGQGNIN